MALQELQKRFDDIKETIRLSYHLVKEVRQNARVTQLESNTEFFFNALYHTEINKAKQCLALAPSLLKRLREDIKKARSVDIQNYQSYTGLEKELLHYCHEQGLELRSLWERVVQALGRIGSCITKAFKGIFGVDSAKNPNKHQFRSLVRIRNMWATPPSLLTDNQETLTLSMTYADTLRQLEYVSNPGLDPKVTKIAATQANTPPVDKVTPTASQLSSELQPPSPICAC
jgi:hypothetical protein